MKFKKVVKIFLSCLMAGALFTGCGGDSGNDKPVSTSDVAQVNLGMITHLNATENQMGEAYNKFLDKADLNGAKHLPKFYDSLRAMQMGIEAGEVKEVSLYKSVADYLVANNDKFELVQNDVFNNIKDSFCFAVRKDEIQLKDDLDKVINEMKADGTLVNLVSDYIVKVDKGQAPPKVDIPTIDDADTIKVGITGDLPPLDLVLADNSPAGFNTAMLAEIAKRLGRNVEPVQIDSGARAAVLASKQIDVIFWAVVPNDEYIPADFDKPDGVEFSTPYFQDSIAHIKLKAGK